MGIFSKLFGGGDDHPPEMPWDRGPSIYAHLVGHLDNDGKLTEEGHKLPDEEEINASSQIRFAPGALDGVMTHHMGGSNTEEAIGKLVQRVLAFSGQPTATNKAAIYQHVIDENTVSMIDPAIEALTAEGGINHQRLYELAYSFATESSDREPVKFGIAILGLFQADNEELFQALGVHDEFTLFCAVALSNSSETPEQSLWTLAKRVEGWGRIHLVERLSEADTPEVKDWLLREGYRNSVMYEYLAYTAATAGGLMEAMSQDAIDRELLTSAGEILSALIAGGPAESIDDYGDAAVVVEMFLDHLKGATETLDDCKAVMMIQHFLGNEEDDWDARLEQGWTAERRAELSEVCRQYLSRPIWQELVVRALQGGDEDDFYQANSVAGSLGIDTWEHHWRRLQEKPDESGRWYQVASVVDEQRLPALLAFAEANLDLTKLASGPAEEMGLGKAWEEYSCLGYLLQDLRRFPGEGDAFINAGLHSPVVSNRNMAINALAEQARDGWADSTVEAIEEAIRLEPRQEVRERMEKILNGEPLEG